MRHRTLTEEEKKDPENSLPHWREVIKEHGPEYVRARVEQAPVSKMWSIFARQALAECEKEQREQVDSRELGRHDREEQALELAREALEATKTGNKIQSWILAVLILTLLVAIATCRAG